MKKFNLKKNIIPVLSLLLVFITFKSSYAEDVFVKYRGLVSLSNFSCAEIKPSSVVNNICYDERNEYLLVQLNTTYYHYCEVPNTIYKSWIDSESLGRFYNTYIKGNYDCRLSEPPQY